MKFISCTNTLKLSLAQALLIFPASELELITWCITENSKNCVRILPSYGSLHVLLWVNHRLVYAYYSVYSHGINLTHHLQQIVLQIHAG